MKLNKKYFLAIFTSLGFQAVLGVNLANAYCETEIKNVCVKNSSSPTGVLNTEPLENCLRESPKHTNRRITEYKSEGVDFIKERLVIWQNNVERNKNARERTYEWARWLEAKLEVCEYSSALAGLDASSVPPQGSAQNPKVNNIYSNQQASSSSSSYGQANQQNSSPEEVERSNMKNNYSQKTAAYEQKYQGRGKKHNIDAFANQCIKTKGRKVLNICDFDVEAVFCAVNPDPNSIHAFETASAFDCARNSIGMWPILARKALSGVFTAESVSVFACKKPSHPSGAEYDHQKRVIVARCSEY